MKRLSLVLFAALLWLTGANPGWAGTIKYTFTGTGTGDVDGVAFSNAAFTITEVGNPSQISSCGTGCFTVNDLLSTIAIAGFPLARVRTPVRVFDNQTVDALGYARETGDDLMDLTDSEFGTYNLATAFGPIFVAAPFAVNQFNCSDGCIATSQGNVAFSSIVNVTFIAALTQASVQSTLVQGVDPAPEPATIALFGLGCFGAGLLWRLRRNKLPPRF